MCSQRPTARSRHEILSVQELTGQLSCHTLAIAWASSHAIHRVWVEHHDRHTPVNIPTLPKRWEKQCEKSITNNIFKLKWHTETVCLCKKEIIAEQVHVRRHKWLGAVQLLTSDLEHLGDRHTLVGRRLALVLHRWDVLAHYRIVTPLEEHLLDVRANLKTHWRNYFTEQKYQPKDHHLEMRGNSSLSHEVKHTKTHGIKAHAIFDGTQSDNEQHSHVVRGRS